MWVDCCWVACGDGSSALSVRGLPPDLKAVVTMIQKELISVKQCSSKPKENRHATSNTS